MANPFRHFLDVSFDYFRHRSFLKGEGGLTYAQAEEGSRRFSGELSRAGIGTGDRVLICCRDCPQTVLIILGAVRSELVFALVHPALPPVAIQAVKEDFRPRAVVLDSSTQAHAGLFSDAVVLSYGALFSRAKQSPSSPPAREADPDTAFAVYTTGSSGAPKGVCITRSNLVFVIRQIQARLGYRADDVIGVFLPLSFDYGLYQIFLAMACGASLCFGDGTPVGLTLLSQVRKYQITVLPCVPSLAAILLTHLKRSRNLPGQLRAITSTGDVLSVSMVEALYRSLPGIRVFPMYGLTECKRVSILLPEEWEGHKGSVGRPLPGTRVFVMDDRGEAHERSAAGELVVQGPHVAAGYLGDPALTREKFPMLRGERSLMTGDICRIDGEGFIYFLSRKDRQMKHLGFRLEPAEVENLVRTLPGAAGAALVQGKEPDVLHLFVLGDGSVTEGQIAALLERMLPPYKRPGRIHVRPRLPVNANGKVDYTALEQEIR